MINWLFHRSCLNRQQVSAMGLSGVMLLGALALLWIGHWLPGAVPEKVSVRQLSVLAPPPPPPPPPAVQQAAVEAPVALQVQGSGPVLNMLEAKPQIQVMKPDLPQVDTRQSQWQSLAVDWNAFDLNALDGLPTLLTALRVKFPRSLSRRGIDRVLVKLDVVIDEQGQLTLVDIVQNPHQELHSEILRLIRSSRFTAPQKEGQPVRARFIWPVEIIP